VNGVSVSRRETPATTKTAAATIASSHFTPAKHHLGDAHPHPPNQVRRQLQGI
jgi:hypothetical protein